MTNLLNKLKESSNKRARNDRLTSSEYERYGTSDFVSYLSTEELAGYDVLESKGINISRSIPNGPGYTKLTPASLEMCMCLKDHLDATDRIQHTSNLENSLDFEEEILEEEVLENEAIALSDEEIALDEAASEARSNESGGEKIDMTLSD
ncbi:hypothetical protein Tco_0862494 [Tanacetum coccineum]